MRNEIMIQFGERTVCLWKYVLQNCIIPLVCIYNNIIKITERKMWTDCVLKRDLYLHLNYLILLIAAAGRIKMYWRTKRAHTNCGSAPFGDISFGQIVLAEVARAEETPLPRVCYVTLRKQKHTGARIARATSTRA